MGNPATNTFMSWVVVILNESAGPILSGVAKTLVIAIISTAIGCLIGFAIGIVQTIPLERKGRPVQWFILKGIQFLLSAYIEIFRGTPMMVQAAFIYYGMAILYDVHMDMWTAAILIVSINTGAYMAETVRGGILSVEDGQTEGAKAIGMSHFQTMFYVVLPQALRAIMPQIGNNLIINIKDTCVLSIIGVTELFYTMKTIAGSTYAFFPTYALAMVVYFILTFTCSRILRVLENKMDGPENFELAMKDALVQGEGMFTYPKKKKIRNPEVVKENER